ncbi:short-chain specific acyl-CoA dehydrogenase, mitochondrial-like isoform X2 [Lutzomyia longipalpis]|uniref:short-chain specific acyl-CoA dehydrogenase, mitochondrial-like isoform X2 n=1 Tax=Lutzomyia longipalpis TaxID=7200 RepID=UPI00248418F9|nr:short-chain specific acyl-CoA dehydrogenase, mitochondrial-like isoform X2 [Lutzomyia longipalpis]
MLGLVRGVRLWRCFSRDGICINYRNFTVTPLSGDHQLIQKACREFAEKELMPVAAKIDRDMRFPQELIEKLGTQGLLYMTVDRHLGGAGLDILSLSLAVEEIARGCSATGAVVSIHNCLYANLLDRLGTEEQKKRFLAPMVMDSSLGAFALSEFNAGSDVAAMSTTARQEGSKWILKGNKAWVTSAREAKAAVVFASVDRNLKHAGLAAFIVPLDTPGVTLGRNEEKMGIRGTSTCTLTLDNVEIPQENILGEIGDGFRIAMEQLDLARIGIASQALGIARACLDLSISYATSRIAFGQSIITMPTVKTRIAEMGLRLEAAQLLTRRAAFIHSQPGAKTTKFSSMAKLAASECATFNSHNCVQILGGMGYVMDLPAERLYRDARITEIYGGVSDIQRQIVADQVIKECNSE